MTPTRKCWNEISEDVLLKVMHLLEDEDRTQVSQVCKTWHKVSQHPGLWRSASFTFNNCTRPLPERLQNIKKYVTSHGEHVQEVSIVCPNAHMLEPKGFARCVHALLSGLSELPDGQCTIRSLQLVNLNLDSNFYKWESSQCLLLYAVSDFIMEQKRLETVDMSQTAAVKPCARLLIQSLRNSQSVNRLTLLDVTNIFGSKISCKDLKKLLPVCASLREIRLNYFYLWSDLLFKAFETLGETLERLVLTMTEGCCTQDMERFAQNMSHDAWKVMCHHCPLMKVFLRVHGLDVSWKNYLYPSIPLVELLYAPEPLRMLYPARMQARLDGLLNRLAECSYRDLRSVSLIASSVAFSVVQPSKGAVINCLVRCPSISQLNGSSQLMTSSLKEEVRSDLLQLYKLERDVIYIV